ncbi:MAG: sulfatase, partial [Planctomycetota bacterium JB042]
MTRRAAPGSRVAGRWTLPFLPFASFLAACSDRASLEVPADTPVVLVVIDTLRADRLGCYGCPLETSPVLDAFAERAFVFEANSTQLNSTFGSLTSIFTGLYPKSHQMFLPVPTEAALASAPDGVSLTERLASRGDHRLGVVSHPSFAETDPRAIVMRGWDAFSVIDPTRPIRERIFCAHGGDTNARLLPRLDEAIEAAGDGPLFVFAHYFDPHTERFDLVYDAPEETRNLFLRHHLAEVGREEVHDELAALPPMERPEWIREHAEGTNDLRLANGRALYDAEIRSCDRHVGTFFDRLRERGLFDRALIVVMADHGENLGHVGRPPRAAAFTHQRLFEGVVHTPLMIKLPHQREGARIPAITQNVDVLPTLVELLGLPEAPPADGKSLVPLLAGEARAVHDLVFMESSDGLERAVRTDAFKLIDPGDGRSPMLFRWRDDPMERNDVRDEVDPENLRRLADALETFTPTTGTFVRL